MPSTDTINPFFLIQSTQLLSAISQGQVKKQSIKQSINQMNQIGNHLIKSAIDQLSCLSVSFLLSPLSSLLTPLAYAFSIQYESGKQIKSGFYITLKRCNRRNPLTNLFSFKPSYTNGRYLGYDVLSVHSLIHPF